MREREQEVTNMSALLEKAENLLVVSSPLMLNDTCIRFHHENMPI